MEDVWGSCGKEGGSYSHVSHAFSKDVGEFVYSDLTESSEMVFFQHEVDDGIRGLESLANGESKDGMGSGQEAVSAGRLQMSESTGVKRFHAKLREATPFETDDGDMIMVSEGEQMVVVGGHYGNDVGEPVLHLEHITEDGQVFKAKCPYSKTIPVIS